MALEKSHKYDDIIRMPHHTSTKHARMASIDRAAQFSPFAALTGYEEATKETARVTQEWRDLDEQEKMVLDSRLRFLWKNRSLKPQATITYFVPDQRKAGGAYCTATGVLHKLDGCAGVLMLEDGTEIALKQIVRVESALLNRAEEDIYVVR